MCFASVLYATTGRQPRPIDRNALQGENSTLSRVSMKADRHIIARYFHDQVKAQYFEVEVAAMPRLDERNHRLIPAPLLCGPPLLCHAPALFRNGRTPYNPVRKTVLCQVQIKVRSQSEPRLSARVAVLQIVTKYLSNPITWIKYCTQSFKEPFCSHSKHCTIDATAACGSQMVDTKPIVNVARGSECQRIRKRRSYYDSSTVARSMNIRSSDESRDHESNQRTLPHLPLSFPPEAFVTISITLSLQ